MKKVHNIANELKASLQDIMSPAMFLTVKKNPKSLEFFVACCRNSEISPKFSDAQVSAAIMALSRGGNSMRNFHAIVAPRAP